MEAAARADGLRLIVNSCQRFDAEQAELYKRHPDPKWVALPGIAPPLRWNVLRREELATHPSGQHQNTVDSLGPRRRHDHQCQRVGAVAL
jgi:hypothetical protein